MDKEDGEHGGKMLQQEARECVDESARVSEDEEVATRRLDGSGGLRREGVTGRQVR